MKTFSGVYASLLEQYISFKRSMGYKYESAEYRFAVFDRFTIEQGCTQVGLTKELCDLWALKRPNETESHKYNRICELRCFSMYLNSIGISSHVIRTTNHVKPSFVPYIFTHDEIRRFFDACDRSPKEGGGKARFELAAPAFFRLLYGCGLRVGEARQLLYCDVHMDDQYLVLRDTKNGNDRMVPFSGTVADSLSLYLKYRSGMFKDEPYFFANAGGRCWSQNAVREVFQRTLFRAAIPYHGKGSGPRIHDFRHTFSVHTLAAMSEQELDLYYSLPILSKYLGHTSLEATDQYVRLTEEMYPSLLEKVDQICAYVFPEVSCIEKV